MNWRLVLGLVLAAAAVPAGAINHDLARGLLPGQPTQTAKRAAWRVVLGSRPLQVFALCGALFHMANASMLGLVGQKLASQNAGQGIALTAASAVAALCRVPDGVARAAAAMAAACGPEMRRMPTPLGNWKAKSGPSRLHDPLPPCQSSLISMLGIAALIGIKAYNGRKRKHELKELQKLLSRR